MKQIFFLFIFGIYMAASASAQVLVSTDPMPKNAILEEFTGIHCTYCPDGHAIANSILEANPGRAFVIALHQGSFASPSAGEPDYRTSFGDAIANQTGLTGYPSGTVNRHVFSGTSTALSRSLWAVSVNQIMEETSPVNLGITSEYEAATRELTVTVELYYTSDAPAASNFINIALIQDSIFGPQTGGGAGSNYRHMHMLRHMITGQWGDEVTETTTGSLISRVYTYVVPESYTNIPAIVENMEVVAFVTEGHQEIYTGYGVPAIGGTNLYIGQIASEEPYIQKSYPGTERSYIAEVNSNIEGTTPFEFWIEAENAPVDWMGSFIINDEEYTAPAVVDVTKDIPLEVSIKVVTGQMAGFPAYTLKMKSVNHPSAPEKVLRVMTLSGVTDLVVNATGGPEAATHQGVYLEGLEASGINSYAVVNADIMRDMVNANAYQDVFTVWLNIAWTFPALTDGQAEAVMAFMDAGHNIFIGGQDIGWDIMSGVDGSNGTPVTRDFYTNYLKAGYVDDGSTANSMLNANMADPVFGNVTQSNIVDVYAGNMYPDQITAQEGADVIFNYTTAAKNAAIKYEADEYRSIYFGIGLEMLSNVEVRNEIIALSRIWLSDGMVGMEYNQAVRALLNGQNYPNPASTYTYISVSDAAAGGSIELFNLNGQMVGSQVIGNGLLVRVDLSSLESGLYTYRVVAANQTSETRKLIVIK